MLRGYHVNALTPSALATLRRARPAIVKTLDHGHDWAAIKAECGIVFLLGREWLDPDANFEPTPEAAAERLFGRMRPTMERLRGVVDAWETPWNERAQRGYENLAGHAQACRRFCELAHGIGIKVAVGNFSVGNPDPAEFAALFAPGMELADYLSLHEYWLPGNFNRPHWVGRRHAMIAALPAGLRRPVIVSECGIDGGLEGKKGLDAGYRAYGVTPNQYAQQLQQFADGAGPWDLGATIFCCGTHDPYWGAFDVSSDAAEVEDWVRNGPREIAAPQPTGGENVSAAELERYCADIFKRAGVPYNANSAFVKYWRTQLEKGRYLGRPEEPEHPTENGRYVVQAFSGAILSARVGEWVVRESLPPFA